MFKDMDLQDIMIRLSSLEEAVSILKSTLSNRNSALIAYLNGLENDLDDIDL